MQAVDVGERLEDPGDSPATLSTAPWIGRIAKLTAPCNSRRTGFDENAISTSVTVSNAMKTTDRRRAVRDARSELIVQAYRAVEPA